MPSGFDLSQAYNLVQSSLQFGKLQSSDDEAQKQKMTFLVSSSSNITYQHSTLSMKCLVFIYVSYLPNVMQYYLPYQIFQTGIPVVDEALKVNLNFSLFNKLC